MLTPKPPREAEPPPAAPRWPGGHVGLDLARGVWQALETVKPLNDQKKEAPERTRSTIDCHRCVPVLMMDQSEERARFFRECDVLGIE